jgi:hypothetical protein
MPTTIGSDRHSTRHTGVTAACHFPDERGSRHSSVTVAPDAEPTGRHGCRRGGDEPGRPPLDAAPAMQMHPATYPASLARRSLAGRLTAGNASESASEVDPRVSRSLAGP